MFVSKPRDFNRLAFTEGDPSLAPLSLPAAVMPQGLTLPAMGLILKRAEDIVVALTALILLSPLILVTVILIRATSSGPAFFRQERVGLHGQRFTMLKFRTMYSEPEQWQGNLRQATRNDARVTRIGGLLRRTSFDEVPQFITVLAGHMSVVGPRPHAPGTCAGGKPFEHITHQYTARHCVKPGMTGLAQIRGWRGETDTEEKLLRRLDSDLEYIANWSVLADLAIMWRTIGAVSRMRNAY